ncbi:hsp70 nucleotide exchange factor fes1 [Coemansia javaensis]|uniref:Hsp70 nucleotide exchange factor fes1 n=1 Tax=Coemansia javaensis TaxID=2761396 RepID=A0A9W8LJB5_9FUNG|nr:hsp70 nucleotide exchange factor fes1 [Coemansia javaensis]
MESLLKWAILNGATAGEDAPPRGPGDPEPKKLDPEVIDAILGKPASVQMGECMAAAEDAAAASEGREVALDNLELLVENIDNAANLGPLGLWPRLVALYGDAAAGVRTGALWVSGTAVQHNPRAQAAFAAAGGLQRALDVLRGDADMGVRTKALYCVSSAVRANPAGLTAFVAADGLPALRLAIEAGSDPLRQKAFFLLRALIDEALDAETPAALRPGMHLPDAIAELRFADAAAAVLPALAAPALEQAAAFLAALAATDRGRAALAACAALRPALAAAKAQHPEVEMGELEAVI